ncbi:TlpA disulfide reductase family protein [Pedobacter sp.]|jgi:thiol-disulfide isomerase/thioredoxin|uniref:TlpA disulfide reductase family protein n=1 Tax=Pedobacter sp. TaxID=1411316 RepID=UPI002C6FA192|nr:TlpA disulfide reductase family protein [Pedobacter sp.]HWW41616.1 TlpA disulfide reductase family protein [Pedobacter sp.]
MMKLKKRMIFLLLALCAGAPMLNAQSFSIAGKVADTKMALDQMIYLKFKQNGKEIKDSAQMVNGVYAFKGTILYPVKAILQLKVPDSIESYYNTRHFLKEYSCTFYLERGAITADSRKKLDQSLIKGSRADANARELEVILKPYYKEGDMLYKQEGRPAYERKDSIAIAAYTKKMYVNESRMDSVRKAFMLSHLQSGVALDMLMEYTRSLMDPREIEPLFNQLEPSLKASDEGKAYWTRIQGAKRTAIGIIAPDFTLKDSEGKEVSLSSLKGKLVLLDFWGSWCYPCRASHPHLKKLYQEYKNKGFEILGVSSESGKAEEDYKKWTTAMKEDGMNWLNVLSNTSRSERSRGILNQYSVTVFPTKILIDKNGVILKRFAGNTPENARLLDQTVKDYLERHKL